MLDLLFVRGVVEAAEEIAHRMRLLRVRDVEGLDWTPGRQVRVHVKDLLSAQTWRQGLPATGAVYGAIEVARPESRLPLPRSAELTWRCRGDAAAVSSAGLLEAVRELPLPAEPGVAYVAGEAHTVQAVRAHLVRERGRQGRAEVVRQGLLGGRAGRRNERGRGGGRALGDGPGGSVARSRCRVRRKAGRIGVTAGSAALLGAFHGASCSRWSMPEL